MIAVDAHTKRVQQQATDPAASAWVSANAGSGKTYVLARRVVRLLLSGANPGSILCLTFTKAAAAEMASRVFGILAGWTRLDDAALDAELTDYQGHTDAIERVKARRLFAEALETPGGLKIQTIHAFCERLLHQFPLEANVAGSFEVLDEREAAILIERARRDMIETASSAPDGLLGQAFSRVLEAASDSGIEEALAGIIEKRDAMAEFIARSGSLEAALAALRQALDLGPDDDAEHFTLAIAEGVPLSDGEIARLAEQLASAGTRHRPRAEPLQAFLHAGDVAGRAEAWLRFLTKSDGKELLSLAYLAPKAVFDAWPSLEEALSAERERIETLLDRIATATAFEATTALMIVGEAVLRFYESAKLLRGALDFQDLIVRTAELLTRSGASAWVHYKLDRGLDHILVDEAQDTSPRQWQVIGELVSEFFAGEGSDPRRRTLFAVGDEKQSIYSFQGAVPAFFSRQRDQFARRAQEVELPFSALELNLSFRSTADVLAAVDRVFAAPIAHTGLTRDPQPTVHQAARRGEPGRVTVWPPIVAEKREEPDEWHQPLDRLDEASPEVRLATRIASTIRQWLDAGERIEATGKPIRPGGILVLTRKRGAQTDAINRALKSAGLPVAGADRLALASHIAVLDLLALADFVLQPEDDLSLAALLKSPLIGLSEEALFAIAHGRRGSLWKALRAATDGPFVEAAERLQDWRGRADYLRPYDFFARILGPDGGRRRFLARLGPEADDVLQEFLAQALAHEGVDVPTLQGFTQWMRAAATQIKRDADLARDEIRVMTVHGAKGLEAEIVFLVDTGSKPVHPSHDPKIVALADDPDEAEGAPLVWVAPGAPRPRTIEATLERLRDKAREEYRRLLYVGLTRARDRLIVCGTARSAPGSEVLWQDLVLQALETEARRSEVALGADRFEALEWRADWTASPAALVDETVATFHGTPLPDWIARPPPATPARRRLAPSSAAGFAEAEPDPFRPAPSAGRAEAMKRAAERGRIVHRLLQALPEHPPERRSAVAADFLGQATDWPEDARMALVAALGAILADPAFAPVFVAGSRAEVPLAGFIATESGHAEVSGRIDRLSILPDRVLLVDFKTSRPPASADDALAPSYIAQMALYRALLADLYPERRIEAALLFTEGPTLIPVPPERLDACISRITAT
ncbi:double-strand break repair helicase AddA [Kaistia algarum]|uniref:double-strand break repair helicase AddA n=1 Tax=Kaistia algarum TaxID=2083279 RepID=UPI001402F3E7|nr:double-strand break repair helicase AddA [Kaistia algarum]MCX5513687.1 double-strand break repair helicase AddA [Kaistia algarum]